MGKNVTVPRAITVGLFFVNGPVLILMLGPLGIFSHAIESGALDRSYNWLGIVVFVLGFVFAWLWWSLSVPRWRIWAYERVSDIPKLKVRAVEVGLTWPDGHFFGKTEIKTQEQRARERALDIEDEDS